MTQLLKRLGAQWMVNTKNHRLLAHWEYTILVTETSHEVLTQEIEPWR